MEIGGAETHILTLAGGQALLGHRVFCASAGGEYVKELKKQSISHFTLPLDKKSPFALSFSAEKILKIAKENNIDIIHAHSRIPAFVLSLVLPKLKKLGCTAVTTAHMPFEVSPLLKKLSYWGEGTVAVSEDIKKYLSLEYGLDKAQITVIENGIDTEKFSPVTVAEKEKFKKSLGILPESTVICTASRSSLSRAALALWLVSHADEILEDGKTLLCLLSGAVGHEKDALEEIISKAKEVNSRLAREAVMVVSGQSDISRLLCAADIFVGVSRSALEAMSAGLPAIIAGNEGVGGIAEGENLIKLRETNFTARGMQSDFSLVAEYIKGLLKKDLSALGASCREYVKNELSSEKMALSVCRFYREIKRKSEKKKILTVGYYGAGNFGDDEACRALCRTLGENYSISFVCRDKEEFSSVSNASCVRQENFLAIKRAVENADCVIFGTGNLLQNYTSNRSLLYYSRIFLLAKKLNKKTALFLNGIGLLKGKQAIRLAEKIVSEADYVSMREKASLDFARQNNKAARLGADIAYLSKYSVKKNKKSSLFTFLDGKKYAVLCPRAGMSKKDMKAVREHFCSLEKDGIATLIIPLYKKQDTDICRELCKKISGSALYLGRLDGGRLSEILKGAEFAFGGRLHAFVMSLCANCAFAGYDRDQRIKANMAYAGAGAYLYSDTFTSKDIEKAVAAEKEKVKQGNYKKAHARLACAAKAELAGLIEFLEQE